MVYSMRRMVKPLKLTPLTINPIFTRREIVEANDGPVPTEKQLQDFKENREKRVEKYLYPQLKKTGNVFHGAQSRNKQIAADIGKDRAEKYGFLKETYDYDVYSNLPEKHAREIENKIDKYYKADMAYVTKESIGSDPNKALNPMHKSTSKKKVHQRWTVMTRVTPPSKNEVDYSTYPDREVKVVKRKGIKHEDIDAALLRHRELVYQPRRAAKTWEDIRRLTRAKAYMEERRKQKGV